MQNIAARYNPYIFLDRNRERTVVYYGRVSTEHEAQLAALENQLQWYDDQTERHSNWNVLQKYIDEGITGTQAKKRPAFLRMLEDARAGKFDLIVTREVCRFARNTVDTLVTTRELKNLGIEVYFVEDNIWTMDGDGELRLTIMATLAQEESRKVSERVRAGQKISRENGVLYGNGNIIGYDRVGSTYVINEEQAETVRIIFDLYLQGAGQTKIAKELCRLGRKDGHGQVSWSASKIGRILHNATYKGYNCYLKSFSNNYLEQKRIKNLDEETYMYVKGDFEPIVSEEIWDKCSEIRKARTTKMIVNKGERTYGKKSTQDVWLRKLRCSCGSTFRKNKWRTNKRGDEVFGYQCYNQVNNGSKAFREKNGLDTEGYCDIRMVGDWKLEIMAKKIFEGIWTEQERKDAILEVYRLLNEYYQSDTKNNQAAASALEGKIARLKNKIDNLISMRADGEITKEEFKSLKDTTEAELNKYMEEKARMSELSNSESGMEFDTEKIRAVLEEALDFSKPKLDDSIIEKFVSQIIPVDNCRYRWDLNFLPNETQSLVCKVEGRKNHADATIEEGSEDEDESPRTYVLSMDYSNISVTAKNAYQSYVLHIQKLQPENRFRSVGVVGHGETVADDFRLSLHKGSVQKKRAVGKMNPIRLRGKILRQRRQFHQFHNVADFAGNVADRTAFQLLKNLSPQGQLIGHTAFGREKSPVCEDDLVRLQELLTKQGFVDTFSIEPDGHPVKLRFVFHRHRPPFSACPAVPPNRQSGHPCSAFPRFSPAVPVRRQ